MKTRFLDLTALLPDRRGVTALEYGIVAAGLATIIVFGFTLFGTDINMMIIGVANSM